MKRSRNMSFMRKSLRNLSRYDRVLRVLVACVFAMGICGCSSITEFRALEATVSIASSVSSIGAGSSAVLTVSATNATAVVVTGTDGSSYTFSPSGGSQTVTPAATTTYTATATSSTGKITATATVTVNAAVTTTVSMTANPSSMSVGSSSVLTVSATNALAVKITGSDGSTYILPASGGTQSVTPSTTTTYTATATGVTSSVTASITVTVIAASPTASITAVPSSVTAGTASVLTVTATNSVSVVVMGSDGSRYILSPTGGTQPIIPPATTVYTVTAMAQSGSTVTASTTVTVIPAASLQSINHVVFMLQENHTFDNYFGMLNPYRIKNSLNIGADGKTYNVDGIDDKLSLINNQSDQGSIYPLFKLTSSCIDDLTSSWLESYGDVSRYNFSPTRGIDMDGFVHTAQNFANNCAASNGTRCSGTFTDFNGRRAMGYYDEGFLNYYYYMASQFSLSDRWFSPVSSKSTPNRIATFTGGTTEGLVFDPGTDDHLSQLDISTIFQKLDQNNVSWKIYYTVTQGACLDQTECAGRSASERYPATDFGYFTYSYRYMYQNPNGVACVAPTQPSAVVGDTTNSFCIDPLHVAPLSTYFADVANGTLPSFAFIEAGYGRNDEHPGSGQPILLGQQQVANVINSLMVSPSWKDSAFFFAFDEGGGPYDHVPPVPGHSNDKTTSALGSTPVASIPDIQSISVNPDTYTPCVPPGGTQTLHCDLTIDNPGGHSTDAAAIQGFAAQLGFRIPNMVISPFTRKHFVSHTPMDHTAILKFVENRFIGSSAHLTARDNAQPNLLEFFDFATTPWATPPTPPAPVSNQSLGYDACRPQTLGP